MLGFTQTVPNNIEGFSGFTFESLSNVIVAVYDQGDNPVEDAFVIVNSTVFTTNSEGIAEFELDDLDPYTVSALKIGYSGFQSSGIFQGGTLFLRATINLSPLVAASGIGGEIQWSPVCNSFRFYNENRSSFYDNESENALVAKPYMYGEQYCQKVQIGETRNILVHTNQSQLGFTLLTLFNADTDENLGNVNTGQYLAQDLPISDTVGNEFTYNIVSFDYTFNVSGNYYFKVVALSGAPDTEMTSEIIVVGDFPNTQLMEFLPWVLDSQVGIGKTIGIRVESQLFRRLPEGKKGAFRPNNKSASNVTQRNKRAMSLQTFMLPPYLHEALAYGFSLGQCTIKGQPFFAESGYSVNGYIDRFNLSNGDVVLTTQSGYAQQTFVEPEEEIFGIIQDDGDILIQDDLDTLITIQ